MRSAERNPPRTAATRLSEAVLLIAALITAVAVYAGHLNFVRDTLGF